MLLFFARKEKLTDHFAGKLPTTLNSPVIILEIDRMY